MTCVMLFQSKQVRLVSLIESVTVAVRALLMTKNYMEELGSDKLSSNPIVARTCRSQLLETMLTELKANGVIFTKQIMTEFRATLNELNVDSGDHTRLCNSLGKHIHVSTLTRNHYALFIPANTANNQRKIIYDEEKFTTHSLTYIFKMKMEEWKDRQSLRKLIKSQTGRFPKSKTFDYSQLLSPDGLDAYFDPDLVSIIDSITTHNNTRSYNTCSKLYQDQRACRIKMIIALLCFTMNPNCCFYQTLVGMMCYAYGLHMSM